MQLMTNRPTDQPFPLCPVANMFSWESLLCSLGISVKSDAVKKKKNLLSNPLTFFKPPHFLSPEVEMVVHVFGSRL